jgi:uncharacterized protein (DUF2236 family)
MITRTTEQTPRPQATLGLADIICEQALLLGAGSTVLYQLADLGTGLGVSEHSTTLARPVDRLRTTLLFVYLMVCGTDEERRKIARMVNKAHGPVRSEGRYTAFDPELQLWVAGTLAHNGLTIYERVFGRLDDLSRERIYRDSQIFGNVLQVKPEMWPATLTEFEDFWDKKLDTLSSTPSIRIYVQRLMSVDEQPRGVRSLTRLQSLMSRGNVDPRVREVLGLTWTPADQRRYDLFWKVFPPLYRMVPRALRQLLARTVIRDTRRRMRRNKRVI